MRKKMGGVTRPSFSMPLYGSYDTSCMFTGSLMFVTYPDSTFHTSYNIHTYLNNVIYR